jgi:hypothetical protein
VDLDVGVGPRRHAAEDLEQRLLAERHRGVGLLAGERARERLGVDRVTGEPVERDRAAVRVGERAEVGRHRLTVVHRVVGVGPAGLGVLPPADERMVEPVLGLGVEGQRQLVLLDDAVVVGQLAQVDDHARTGLVDHSEPAYVGHPETASLAAEPACHLDEVRDLLACVGGERRARRTVSRVCRELVGAVVGVGGGAGVVGHGVVASSGGAVSRNQ